MNKSDTDTETAYPAGNPSQDGPIGKNGLRSLKLGRPLLLVILAVVIFVLYSFAMYAAFTSKWQGGSDFFPRWSCARMLFLEGKSPYSLEATHRTQRALYDGRLAVEGEDQVTFVEPIYSLYFVAPLMLLRYAQAEAVWMVVLQFALFAILGLCMVMYGWRPPPWLAAATGVWMILNYNSGEAIIVGQLAVIVALMVVLAMCSLQSGHDLLAGVFLALSTIKPQMVFLVIPLLLLWALLKRRWNVCIGFALAMLVLVGSGWLLVPGWIFESIAGMQRYAQYTAYGGPVWLLTEYYLPVLGRLVNLLLTVALACYLLWSWLGILGIRQHGRHGNLPHNPKRAADRVPVTETQQGVSWPALWWGVGLALIITKFVTPRTATTNYVILYIPVLLVFCAASTQFRLGKWYVLAFEIITLVGFWVLFAATVVPERGGNLPQEDPIMYFPLPVLLLLAFALGRDWLTRTEPTYSTQSR